MNTKELNCIVVDDSKTSRRAVANLIAGHNNLVLSAMYRNAVDALDDMQQNEIDLIFLDIEMPLMDGFEFLNKLQNPPQVILFCDKSEYALKAFEYDITDYLKKPIDRPRFNMAVRRAVVNYLYKKENAEREYINVKTNLQNKKIFIDQINFIEGLGDYIRLATAKGNHLILTTMKSFLKKLPQNKFMRVHNSYAINTNKVDQFNSRTVEIGGKEIPVSRKKSEDLKKMLIHV